MTARLQRAKSGSRVVSLPTVIGLCCLWSGVHRLDVFPSHSVRVGLASDEKKSHPHLCSCAERSRVRWCGLLLDTSQGRCSVQVQVVEEEEDKEEEQVCAREIRSPFTWEHPGFSPETKS